jgi:1,4-dihydroxy-2-naphthoate polyprenyltransferase
MIRTYSLFRPDTQMWRKALKGIPRVKNKRQWDALDPLSRWLISTRAAVLIMTLFAAIFAGIYAQLEGMFDWTRFLFVAVGLVLAHATNNILNDLADHNRGVDKDNAFRTQYGTQPVEDGFMSRTQSRRMAFITGLLGVLTGVYLVVTAGSQLLLYFLLAGIVFLFAYNWPLKHIGLGEPLVVVVWGPMMIGGGFLAITGYWSWEVAIASLPYALGPTAVLFGKHIDKIPWDKPRKVRTLPVLIGEHAARKTTMALLALQYLVVFYLIFTGFFAWTLALVVLAIPYYLGTLRRVFARPKPEKRPASYPEEGWPLYFVSYAFVHNRKFGGLFLLGLIAQVVLNMI